MNEYKAQVPRGSTKYRIAIVVSEFNSMITEKLLQGALEALQQAEIEDIDVYWVPGAYEIPVTCARVLEAKKADGIVTLGAVIRGETPHFDYVASAAATGISKVSLEYKKPIAFGVLTTDTIEQALNRSGLKYGNKGKEAALSLLETLSLYHSAGI
ncbi:MAG: 6,7-dimethyl-8-ribityllumazine synthase [Candidatus Hydrogenedentota bacterium]|nr:MAG: 6,7-dimethyl-8-ribityllumazine synthase [Candidatus Hydrogenedentota bacterium]